MGYGAAIGGILAALIGGGSQVGGGLLAADEAKGTERTATQLPSSNLLNQIASMSLLSRLGYGAPTPELLLDASPLAQSLNRRFATPVSRESRRRILDSTYNAVDYVSKARASGDTRSASEILLQGSQAGYESGQAVGRGEGDAMGPAFFAKGNDWKSIVRAANEGGFDSVDAMLEAELEYRRKIPELMAQQQNDANKQRELQGLATNEQIAALRSLGSVSDVGMLRDQERTRLLRDLDLQQQNVLSAANAGGYNPSGGLEALARARTDADVEALNRAIASATGQTAIASQRANTAKSLDPTLIALGLAPQLTSGGTTSNTQSQGGNGALGAGVANAGAIGAGGILDALDAYTRARGPAATQNQASQYNYSTSMPAGWALRNY